MAKPTKGFLVLKWSVLIMGVMLFFGTIALFVAIYYKFSTKTEAKTEIQQSSGPCVFMPTSNVDIAGEVSSTSLNGNLLTLLVKKNRTLNSQILEGNILNLSANPQLSQQVIIFDLCTGEVVSRVDVD